MKYVGFKSDTPKAAGSSEEPLPRSSVSLPPEADTEESLFGAYVIEPTTGEVIPTTSQPPSAAKPHSAPTENEAPRPKRRRRTFRETVQQFKSSYIVISTVISVGVFFAVPYFDDFFSSRKDEETATTIRPYQLDGVAPPKLNFVGNDGLASATDVSRLFKNGQPASSPRNAPSVPLDMGRAPPPPPTQPPPVSVNPPVVAPSILRGPAWTSQPSTPTVRRRVSQETQNQDSAAHAGISAPRQPPRPLFVHPGGTIKVLPQTDEGRSVLAVGQRFAATLQLGVSSSRASKVLARVKEDVLVGGRVVLRANDLLEGQASSDQARLYLEFKQVTTGGRKVGITGEATLGDMIGIGTDFNQKDANEGQSRSSTLNAAMNSLKAAAQAGVSTLADATLPGRIVGNIASNVARDTATQVQRQKLVTSTIPTSLQLPAGTEFEIVITGD